MNSERLETDLFDTLRSLARPNHITETHQRALELQQLLDEFSGTLEERAELASAIVDDLDRAGNHLNHAVIINGSVLEGNYNLNTIDFDEEVVIDTQAREYNASELHAISRGYCVVQQRSPRSDEGRIVIFHLAQTPITTVTTVRGAGNVYKDTYVYVPIDGTAEVEDIAVETGPHMPLIEYYLGDVVQDIDVAVLNGTSPTEILRKLGSVDLSQFPGVINYKEIREELIEEIYDELLKYLDHITNFNRRAPHHLTGISELIIEDQEDSTRDKHLFVDDSFYGIGEVEGFSFYPTQDDRLELALVMQLYFDNASVRRAYIPLNEHIRLDELTTPDITR